MLLPLSWMFSPFRDHSQTWLLVSTIITLCLSYVTSSCPNLCICPANNTLNCSSQNLTYIPLRIINRGDITHLIMSHNQFGRLSDHSFQVMEKLQTLYLDHSGIYTLSKSTFSGLQNLQDLSLHGNHLHSLTDGVFYGLTKLQTLDLSGNLLTEIPQDVFLHTPNLKYLDLRDNALVDMRNETFTALNTLLWLHLAGNPLTILPPVVFQPLWELMMLNLSNTRMEILEQELCSNLTTLQSLDISQNKLKMIDPSALDNLPHLQYLNLSGNPISCECEVVPFKNWSETNTKLVWLPNMVPECNEPPWLTDLSIFKLLRNVSCELWHVGRKFIIPRVKMKEKLPYNRMMGWYTAATLSGMLVLFLLCVVLDKLKRRFYRWRRARRDRQEKYKFQDGRSLGGVSVSSRQNSFQSRPRHSIDCMDSISIVVTNSYLDDPPQTIIEKTADDNNDNMEPKKSTAQNQTKVEINKGATGDLYGLKDKDTSKLDGTIIENQPSTAANGPLLMVSIPHQKLCKKHRHSSKEKQQMETSI